VTIAGPSRSISLSRKDLRRKPLSFAAWACSIIVLNELILPATPRQVVAMQRSLEGVKVSNIRDDLFLSAAGNPIGVRFTFDLVVAESGSYGVSPFGLQPEGRGSQWAFELNRRIRQSVEPDLVEGVFRKGVRYTFSQVYLPNFLKYDDQTAQPCFDRGALGNLSEEAFVAALLGTPETRLRSAIRVGREEARSEVTSAEYVTGRTYDLGAFYRTIVAEGNRRCDS
jgi:hypothetical protein